MYHYVRPEQTDLPYFRYLHLEDFSLQLDWLEENFGFISRDDFEHSLVDHQPVEGAILTFDDGFSDHYHHVFPELVRRGLWGMFYVSTGVYANRTLLDVHRIHVMIGCHGGAKVLETLTGLVEDHMLVDKDNVAFRTNTYRFQNNDDATNEAKRILNYYISYEYRHGIMTSLFRRLMGGEEDTFGDFYLSLDQMREMSAAGMVIGSHSVSHPVFSKLDVNAQWAEIDGSFTFLERTLSTPVETFCYPYGGFHNFTVETEHLLERRGCRFAFNVEPRDIDARDLNEHPMALPRYDCNMFAYGLASQGANRPA